MLSAPAPSRRGPSKGGRHDFTSPVTGLTLPIRPPKSCDHQTVWSGATSQPYATAIGRPLIAGSAGGSGEYVNFAVVGSKRETVVDLVNVYQMRPCASKRNVCGYAPV